MKLNFRTLGEGQPLLILHGLFGSSDNWQTLGKQFSAYFKVYLIDQRNHGHSPKSDIFDYDVLADDIANLIQSENLSNCLLLGHSMGGKTVMRFAAKYPEKVSKLIVADIAPKAYPPHHDVIIEALQSVDLKTMNTRKAVEDHITTFVPDFGTKQFLLKNLYWNDNQQLDWRINIPVLVEKMPIIVGSIGSDIVHTPTLFVRGEKSGYIKDSDQASLFAQFPQSTLATITGAGHWLHAEKPKEFFETCIQFLQN